MKQDYKIVVHRSFYEVEKRVNKLLSDGYNLSGNLLTERGRKHIHFIQAMMGYVDESDLSETIESLELTIRSNNCLKGNGINNISQLIMCTSSDLLSFEHLGRKSLTEIKDVLALKGLRLAE